MERRAFLAGAAALAAAGWGSPSVAKSDARAKVVIAGAGAAGLSIAARLARQMPNATITIFDARRDHYFQPGWTLVGAGWWTPSQTVEPTRSYIPSGVTWVEQNIIEFNPDSNEVTDASGQKHTYDWLFVATGLSLDYDQIPGMSRDLIGRKGIASIYAGPQAYRSVMQDMVSRHGPPLDPSTGKPMEMIIVGMGKLGGGELNVSSDIDLIMLYGDEGETQGPRPLSYHEFFGNVTRRMMPIISEADEHGQVFRTDLRLRPDGDAGPLAWSLDAFEQYLFTQGREWERYAWLKGRIMPATFFSDSDMGRTQQHVESMRQPFVYRKYFDFDALAALRDLRERIRQDWQRRASAR
jgi:hypothetical protein